MKRFSITLLLVAIATVCTFAQTTLTKNYKFGKITSIEASSIYEIYVTQGNSGSVKIDYDNIYEDRLIVKYFNGHLNLALDQQKVKIKNNNEASIKVYLQMPSIEEIDLSGASSLHASGNFSTNSLEIDLSGASSVSGLNINGNALSIDCSGASSLHINGDFTDVEAEVSGAASVEWAGKCNYFEGETSGAASTRFNSNMNTTEIECSGASDTRFYGSTGHLKAIISGASEFKGKDFSAKNAHVELTGASSAHVRCTGDLTVRVNAASKLTHYGRPNIINLNKDNNIRKGD